MNKDRIIHLLTDEDVGLILTGLRFLEQDYIKREDRDGVFFVGSLYDRIDKCEDMGVITSERI